MADHTSDIPYEKRGHNGSAGADALFLSIRSFMNSSIRRSGAGILVR